MFNWKRGKRKLRRLWREAWMLAVAGPAIAGFIGGWRPALVAAGMEALFAVIYWLWQSRA